MKKNLFLFLVSIITLLTSCYSKDNPVDEPVLKAKIVSYNEFGCAMPESTQFCEMCAFLMSFLQTNLCNLAQFNSLSVSKD